MVDKTALEVSERLRMLMVRPEGHRRALARRQMGRLAELHLLPEISALLH